MSFASPMPFLWYDTEEKTFFSHVMSVRPPILIPDTWYLNGFIFTSSCMKGTKRQPMSVSQPNISTTRDCLFTMYT